MVRLRVNGEQREIETEPRRTLLAALRLDLGLTGAKEACDKKFLSVSLAKSTVIA